MNATNNGAETPIPGSRPSGPLEIQFQYAWDWFEYHARQRVTMFNYFLLAMGILATAYVQSLRQGPRAVALAVALMGVVVSAIFWLLDWRNKQLVDMGEQLLRELEQKRIFAGFGSGRDSELQHALLHEEELNEKAATAGGRGSRSKRMQARFLKHEFLIRGLETVVLAFFLFATLYALFAPPIRDNPRAQVVRPGRPDQRGTQAGRSAKPTTQVLARQEEEARGISQTWALAGVVATVLAAIAATLWQFGARLTQF